MGGADKVRSWSYSGEESDGRGRQSEELVVQWGRVGWAGQTK